jgi:intraflagellar transport protein 172
VFADRGAPCVPNNFGAYKRIAQEVLSHESEITDTKPLVVVPRELRAVRTMLYQVALEVREVGEDQTTAELGKFGVIAHLAVVKIAAMEAGLKTVAAKAAMSLLRYTMDIPVDRAFFDAGTLCQAANWQNMAFVFYNRFVDLSDMIEDPDSGDIDNSDFLVSDIPSPFDVPMPSQHSCSEEVREEIREWVLEQAMSNDMDASLNLRRCDKCNKETYEAGLQCHSCRFTPEMCVVTGFPVARHSRVTCRQCGKSANKDDWNAWVLKCKVCPWCETNQNPAY